MGEAIARQHPAVVLRSQFDHLRALLAVALIAVAGLTVAVVILATDDDAGTGSATVSEPAHTTRYYGGQGGRGPLPAALPKGSLDGGTRSAVEAKNEAASAAAIAQSSDGTVTRGSKASQFGTSQYRFAQPQTGAPVQPQTGTSAQP
jgi:hypothetical protein